MGDKGRWSIVNPAGEEVTFHSREELKQAVLDDEIEPHAESIPPEEPQQLAEGVSRHSRPTPFMGEAEALSAAAAEEEAFPTEGPAAAAIVAQAGVGSVKIAVASEGEVAEDVEAPPSSVGVSEMDPPTLQFTKPHSVPPAASRQSPPEDEGSPLSLSEVGGTEDDERTASVILPPAALPPSISDMKAASRLDASQTSEITLPLVRPKLDDEEQDQEDAKEDAKAGKKEDASDDEKTVPEMEVEASDLEDPPETPKRVLVRETTPPPLPAVSAGDRRSRDSVATGGEPRTSKTTIPPLPGRISQRLSTPARLPVPTLPPGADPRGGIERVTSPRISMKPERASITAPSLPPPDILPDGPARQSVAATPAAASPKAPAKKATTPKPSWLVPIALVGIGIAFWLGTKSNHVPAPESATKTAESATPVAVSSSVVQAPATPPTPAEPEETARPIEPSEPVPVVSAAPSASTPPAANPTPAVSTPPPTPPVEKPRPAAATPANPTTPATPAASAPDPNGALGPLLKRAAAVQRTGDYGAARQIYQSLLQKEPKNPEVLVGMGDTARALGDKAGARSYYARALDASSTFLPALLGLADTEWDLGERAAAQKHYAAIVEHHTNAPERARQRAKGGVTP